MQVAGLLCPAISMSVFTFLILSPALVKKVWRRKCSPLSGCAPIVNSLRGCLGSDESKSKILLGSGYGALQYSVNDGIIHGYFLIVRWGVSRLKAWSQIDSAPDLIGRRFWQMFVGRAASRFAVHARAEESIAKTKGSNSPACGLRGLSSECL